MLGYRQVICVTSQPALRCIHPGTHSFPSATPASQKHQQLCSEQPQDDALVTKSYNETECMHEKYCTTPSCNASEI